MTGILGFWVFDFGLALYRSLSQIDGGYSVIAHLTGTVTGVLLGFMVLKNIKVEWWEKTVKVVCSSLFFFLMGMALGVNLTGSRRAAGLISAHLCPPTMANCTL